MDASTDTFAQATKRRHKAVVASSSIGICLGCGSRLTLCGAPFTANIQCSKCRVINKFYCSQQPVGIVDMEAEKII
jgi:hypothetical protein